MELSFQKYHGLGNDFVMIDNMNLALSLTKDHVSFLCDRHFGIGADGVILVEPGKTPSTSAFMNYINADGSFAEMCGNGLRCTARWLIDNNYIDASCTHFAIDTRAGVKDVDIHYDAHECFESCCVNMGKAQLEAKEIPTILHPSRRFERTSATPAIDVVADVLLKSPFGNFTFTCVSMGNPHAVCFVTSWDDLYDSAFSDPQNKCLETLRVDSVGAFFEAHAAFPQHANIEFVDVSHAQQGSVSMRVFERGCGETLACGTGACAVGVASVIAGYTEQEVDVHLRGGVLHISWDPSGVVYMQGPATQVYSGTIHLL